MTELDHFKTKRLLKTIKEIQGGSNTSMISLLIPAGDQISQINSKLTVELGTASNIKSRVNRQSVETAIESAMQKLKLYNKVPPNGLAIFTGIGSLNDGKGEKRFAFDFEPLYPLKHSLYKCDDCFHVEYLEEQLQDDGDKVGYVIISGHSCFFGEVTREDQKKLYEERVSLPKKHGRGGQSSVRFARLTEIARNNYSRLMAEATTRQWIKSDVVTINKLIIGGSQSLRRELIDNLDPRLKNKLVCEIDLAYGGQNGFTQAVRESKQHLDNSKLNEESEILSTFFKEIDKKDGNYLFGKKEILQAFDSGAIETLLVYNELDEMYDDETNLLDWILENAGKHGITIKLVSGRTALGSQFVKGFGGLGAMVRYKLYLEEEYIEEKLDDDELFI